MTWDLKQEAGLCTGTAWLNVIWQHSGSTDVSVDSSLRFLHSPVKHKFVTLFWRIILEDGLHLAELTLSSSSAWLLEFHPRFLAIALTRQRKDINHSSRCLEHPPPHQPDTSIRVSNAFLWWNQGWSRFPAKFTGISDLLRVLGSEGPSSQFPTEHFDHFQGTNRFLSAVMFCRVPLMWCQGRRDVSQSIICRCCNKAVATAVSLFF